MNICQLLTRITVPDLADSFSSVIISVIALISQSGVVHTVAIKYHRIPRKLQTKFRLNRFRLSVKSWHWHSQRNRQAGRQTEID